MLSTMSSLQLASNHWKWMIKAAHRLTPSFFSAFIRNSWTVQNHWLILSFKKKTQLGVLFLIKRRNRRWVDMQKFRFVDSNFGNVSCNISSLLSRKRMRHDKLWYGNAKRDNRQRTHSNENDVLKNCFCFLFQGKVCCCQTMPEYCHWRRVCRQSHPQTSSRWWTNTRIVTRSSHFRLVSVLSAYCSTGASLRHTRRDDPHFTTVSGLSNNFLWNGWMEFDSTDVIATRI